MLNQAQYDSKVASQSAIARKVLQSVPIAEPWPRTKIKAELRRITNGSLDPRTVDGCIISLADGGLIRKVGTDDYIQVRPHEKAPKAPIPGALVDAELTEADLAELAKPTGLVEAAKTGAPFVLIPQSSSQRLDALSDRLVEMAAELNSIRRHHEQELETMAAKGAKLDELTNLLDSLRR